LLVVVVSFSFYNNLFLRSYNVLVGLRSHFFPTDPTKIVEIKNDLNDPNITVESSLRAINEKLEMFAT
jgi:hypothetical protein